MSYTAVVLDKMDQHRLLARMSPMLVELKPSGFSTLNEMHDLLCHHMTCNMGSCPAEAKQHLGQPVIMQVVGWGVSDKALAIKVSVWEPRVPCSNKNPHITVAVNPTVGGKPKHSNEITLWFDFPEPISVLGTFREVTN